MNHLALITKTRSLIAAGDIAGAESALTELADTEGDSALMVVLDQLEPKDILAVMREYDPSRESVVSLLVTPAQFAHAIVIEKRYKDLTHTHLRGMVNAIVFREDADPVAFLTAVGDLEGGSEAMANYFAQKWARIESFARTGTFDTAEEDGEMLSETELLASAYATPRSRWTRWPTRTGWSWPGACATSAPTSSPRPCWSCVLRHAPMTSAWRTTKRPLKKKTRAWRPATPIGAAAHRRHAKTRKSRRSDGASHSA
jgi:hypothetical protein